MIMVSDNLFCTLDFVSSSGESGSGRVRVQSVKVFSSETLLDSFLRSHTLTIIPHYTNNWKWFNFNRTFSQVRLMERYIGDGQVLERDSSIRGFEKLIYPRKLTIYSLTNSF